MPKHHHQTKAEQIACRIHDAKQAQQNQIHYQKNAPVKSEDILQMKGAQDEIKTSKKKFS